MKKILLPIMLVCMSFLMTSCITMWFKSQDKKHLEKRTQIWAWTFDETLPAEKTANILFWFNVSSYNGIDIREVFSTKKDIDIKSLVTVPSGPSEFTFDFSYLRSNGDYITVYKVTDLIVKYNFEPGKKYYISIGAELKSKGGFFKNDQYSYHLRIYEGQPEFNIKPKQSNVFTIKEKQFNAFNKDRESRRLASFHLFDTDVVEAKK